MRHRLTLLLIRSAGLLTLLAGTALLVAAAADFKRHFGAPDRSFVDNLSAFLQSLDGPLWVGTAGGVVCALTRLVPVRVRGRAQAPAEPYSVPASLDQDFEHERLPTRLLRWLAGVATFLLACVLGLVLGALRRGLVTVWARNVRDPHLLPLVGLLSLPLTFIGALIVLRTWVGAFRLLAPRAETLLRRKRRRPVLYLRSFRTDVAARSWEASSALFGGLLGWLPETHERALAKAVADVGPLVAVGRPGERLPPLGAARLYVREEWRWQQVVADLVAASQLVILRPGETDGFWWELRHLVANCDPKMVLIYLPADDRGELYSWLRYRAVGVLPLRLPPSPGRALFLGFGPGWVPRLYGTRGPSSSARLRRLLAGSPAPALREALNGALKRLALNARRLPFKPREWLILGFIALWLALSLLAGSWWWPT
jgi:hypothetical protein